MTFIMFGLPSLRRTIKFEERLYFEPALFQYLTVHDTKVFLLRSHKMETP